MTSIPAPPPLPKRTSRPYVAFRIRIADGSLIIDPMTFADKYQFRDWAKGQDVCLVRPDAPLIGKGTGNVFVVAVRGDAVKWPANWVERLTLDEDD